MKNKTKVVVISLLVFTFTAFSWLTAQTQTSGKMGGAGYFSVGMAKINLDDLNARLAAKGLPEFSNDFFSMGGGGLSFKNKLIFGGEGYGLMGQEKKYGTGTAVYKQRVDLGYGFFDIGYMLYSGKQLNFFPMLGIGGGGVSMRIIQIANATFDELLTDPGRNVEISKGAFLLNFSLNAHYFFSFNKSKRSAGGLLLGVQAGYLFAPYTSDWKNNENDVTGGPDFDFTGPYINLQLGGGGMDVR